MKYTAALILAALVATPAIADSDKMRNAYVRLDNALNSEYKRALNQLTPESQLALRAEQRDWVAERNQQCGSPDQPVTDAQVVCLGDMTVERLEVISALVKTTQQPRQLPGKFNK